jgi:hypothetical protein
MNTRTRKIGTWITAAALTLIVAMGVIALAAPDAPNPTVDPNAMVCWDEPNQAMPNGHEPIYGPRSAAPEGAQNFRPAC